MRVLDRAAHSPFPPDQTRQVWRSPMMTDATSRHNREWAEERAARIEAHGVRVALDLSQHDESLRRVHSRWTAAETRKLRRMLGRGTPLDRIAQRMGRSRDSVRLKIIHLRRRQP